MRVFPRRYREGLPRHYYYKLQQGMFAAASHSVARLFRGKWQVSNYTSVLRAVTSLRPLRLGVLAAVRAGSRIETSK